MIIYRIEHSVSGLGPFTHRSGRNSRYQSSLVMKLIDHADPMDFDEFWEWKKSKGISIETDLLPPQYRFGWSTEEKLISFLKKGVKLARYGGKKKFRYVAYIGEPEVTLPDGQVIFNWEKSKRVI